MGCVLYMLCTLKHPFDTNEDKILTGNYDPLPHYYTLQSGERKKFSKEIKKLVENML